ncbi:MAG: FKBP-type peptidyl-prolyl cis-trans isomerase, partial [Ignavibacteria bacterium]
HYTGTTIDGKVFDSSVERGEPIEFPLSGVIAGWTEGVALMPVGSKYTLYIPSNLAYGEQGAGQSIGPNEALIFEVELLDITK